MGLTALTGESVMALIMIQGKQPKGDLEFRIDITVDPVGNEDDPDFILCNSGPGKYFPGGPRCQFRNKDVPALIRWHESGSITSQILREALETMDYYDLFPRTDPNVKPFMLLDGHQSRLELPFLQYINNPVDHWVVCLGVPFGTALWQVGDTKEQNGSFNMAMTEGKNNLLALKEKLQMPSSLVPTDILPLINYAWKRSFARVRTNSKAIAERGWFPYNRNIMTFPEIRETMTKKETEEEMTSADIILPITDTNYNQFG